MTELVQEKLAHTCGMCEFDITFFHMTAMTVDTVQQSFESSSCFHVMLFSSTAPWVGSKPSEHALHHLLEISCWVV